MLTIRLTRRGKKNQPFFKVVVIDKIRSTKGGRAVEVLGFVDPLTKRKSLEKERILYWLKCGAKPSATINNLLIQEKIIEGQKIHVSKLTKAKAAKIAAEKAVAEKIAETTASPAEAPKSEGVAPAPAEIHSPEVTETAPVTEEPKK